MARYIDADKIVYWVRYVSSTCLESDVRRIAFLDEIERMPTEDVVPVVRCKDCKHYKQLYDITTGVKKPYGVCTRHSNRFTDEEVALDGFCMYGIRRIDDEE